MIIPSSLCLLVVGIIVTSVLGRRSAIVALTRREPGVLEELAVQGKFTALQTTISASDDRKSLVLRELWEGNRTRQAVYTASGDMLACGEKLGSDDTALSSDGAQLRRNNTLYRRVRPQHLAWIHKMERDCTGLKVVSRSRRSSPRKTRHGRNKLGKSRKDHLAKGGSKEDLLRLPGTMWCGRGYSATSYRQLGAFSQADRCCRRHDTACPFYVPALSHRYGLYNWRPSTLMHCSCDRRFRTCLKMADTGASNFVGKLFFNVVQTKCFVLKAERVCTQRNWWGKCQKQELKKIAHIRSNMSY